MKKYFLLIVFIIISVYCFAENEIPSTWDIQQDERIDANDKFRKYSTDDDTSTGDTFSIPSLNTKTITSDSATITTVNITSGTVGTLVVTGTAYFDTATTIISETQTYIEEVNFEEDVTMEKTLEVDGDVYTNDDLIIGDTLDVTYINNSGTVYFYTKLDIGGVGISNDSVDTLYINGNINQQGNIYVNSIQSVGSIDNRFTNNIFADSLTVEKDIYCDNISGTGFATFGGNIDGFNIEANGYCQADTVKTNEINANGNDTVVIYDSVSIIGAVDISKVTTINDSLYCEGISVTGGVDGVDISDFKTLFDNDSTSKDGRITVIESWDTVAKTDTALVYSMSKSYDTWVYIIAIDSCAYDDTYVGVDSMIIDATVYELLLGGFKLGTTSDTPMINVWYNDSISGIVVLWINDQYIIISPVRDFAANTIKLRGREL